MMEHKYGTYIGDPSKEYIISINDYRRVARNLDNYNCSLNLVCAMAEARNLKVVVDHDLIASRIPEWTAETGVMMCNKNQSLSSFFMLNDQVFMLVNTDCPQSFADEWIPYYSKLCSAFFVMQYRFSTLPLFELCSIPVFPFPMGCGSSVPVWCLEKARMSQNKRDIPVFFSGRRGVRPRRKVAFDQLVKRFPGSVMNDSTRKMLSSKKYCDYMCRSKIAWCPRSVYCNPDSEENGVTNKECEAMCAQSMVIRHALHVKETELRIPGVHFVETETLEKDLYEKINYYLSHDEEREEIARNGRLYYERNCSPLARAHYFVNRCLEAMGEPFEENS